jgi:hypothetical protein
MPSTRVMSFPMTDDSCGTRTSLISILFKQKQ